MKNFTRSIFKKCLLVSILLLALSITNTYGQTTVFYESFDNPTGPPGFLPTTWTISNFNLASGTYSGDASGQWGRDFSNSCTINYNGVNYYSYYPQSDPPYYYAYAYTSGTGQQPYGHNSTLCTSGYMWYGTYENNPGSWGEAATPAINFNATYTGTGGFLLTFWVFECNNNTTSNNAKIDVYINTSHSSTGATQLGGDIVPWTVVGTSGQWVKYAYTLPAAYNTSPSVYIIFRGAAANPQANNPDLLVDDVTVQYVPPCNGTPSAPIITSNPLSTAICAGTSTIISATDTNITPGISYIWQSAPTATGPWTNVTTGSGIGTLNYTVPGVTDTTYFRVVDSCQNSHATIPSATVYRVPVIKYTLPYTETFNNTATGSLPTCYTYNDNFSTNWAVASGLHSPDGTTLTAMHANDPASNAAYGKNDFFTIPGFTLTGSQVYAVHFKYARGRQDAIANTGNAYPEHLQVYANSVSPGYTVSAVTGGTQLMDQTITFDNVADTTLYFAPPTTGSYYFSWYTNTAHPGGATSTIAGGQVIVDSVYIGTSSCVAPAVTNLPSVVNSCLGAPASLTVTTTGTANTYQWYKGGVLKPNVKGPVYSVAAAAYTDSGLYTVVVTNPCGTVNSGTMKLTVSPLPTTTVTPNGPTTFCVGTNFTLLGPTGGGYSYVWRTAGVANGATSQNYIPTASGVYSLKVTGPTGCTDTSAHVTVTINSAPTAVITPSGPTSFCFGDSVTLIASTGAGLTYQWYQNNTAIGAGLGGTAVTYDAQGQFAAGTYKVVVSNTNCSTTSANTVVTATAPPPATVTSTGNNNICAGTSLVLYSDSATGYKYQWKLNGNNISDTTTTYAATNAGDYSVTVTAGNCSATSVPLSVNVISSPPAIVNATGTVICAGSYIVLNADTSATAPQYTFQWQLNGMAAGSTTYTDTITTGGDYTVVVTSSNGCSTTSPVTPATVYALPSAAITVTGSDTVCDGNVVHLVASAGNGYTYQWLSNSTGPVAGATGEYYDAAKTDMYRVAVKDQNGCTDTTTAATSVTVDAIPAVNIFNLGATSFCPGGSVVLSAGPGTAASYKWYVNGINTGITTATYTATTTGVVTVQVTNTNGCSAVSAPVSTTLNTPPPATIQANSSVNFCAGGSVTLTAPLNVGYTYLWKDKIGTVLSNTSSYTATATDSIDLRITDNATSCSATSSFGSTPYLGVTLNPSPGATAAALGATTICNGNNVTLAADTNASAGITYQWKLNSNILGGAVAPSYTATTGGSYTVATSNGACTTTSSPINITVNPTPSATITPLSSPVICSNSFVTLSATTTAGYTYSWQRNGHPLSGTGATSPFYTTDTAGNYTLVVTSNLGCAGTSAPTVVTVNAAPGVILTPVTATTACQGDTVKLYASVTGGSVAYKWLKDEVVIPSAINSNFATTASGQYVVIVTNASNCSDTTEAATVTINPAPTPVITQNNNVLSAGTYNSYQWYLDNKEISGAKGSTFTAYQLGNYSVLVSDNNSCAAMSPVLDVTSLTTTGVNNIAGNADVRLYPNPTTSIVHIEASIPVNAKVSGLDGKILIQAQHATSVDLGQLANGVYMISLYDDNNMLVKIEKLVKSGS